MIQSLEDLVSMAIQGTQVPMYTKHTLFLYFSDFSIFFIKFLYEKQNKAKQSKAGVKHTELRTASLSSIDAAIETAVEL